MRPSLLRPLVAARTRHRFALAAFLLALIVRGIWVLGVQSPLTAIYSDMGGYVSRAEGLLAGTTPGEPRVLVMWPWGTHYILAAEFSIFGRNSVVALGLINAVVGAIAAPCATLLVARLTRSKVAVLGAGLAVALWHPHIVYSGFFSSEIWFSATIMVLAVLVVRHFEGRSGALVAGVVLAICFVCRPQIVMTCGLVGLVVVATWLRRPALRPRGGIVRFVLPLVVPLMIAMGVSALRFHRITGEYGLIATNEPLQRLFGETSVGHIDAAWTAPDGSHWTWWITPATKHPVKPEDAIVFHGFVYDPKLIAEARRERLKGVSAWARVRRAADNVSLLVARNVPWPENDYRRVPFRDRLQNVFAGAIWAVLVLGAVGLFSLRRHRVAGLIIAAQLVTIVFVAAVYLGEARYRVPYDPFLLVCATLGADRVVRAARGLARRVRGARGPRRPHRESSESPDVSSPTP